MTNTTRPTRSLLLVALGCLCLTVQCSFALSATNKPAVSRKAFVKAAAFALVAPVLAQVQPASALDKLNLSDAQLKDIIKSDILDKQFLVTGDLTSSVYRDTATFTDEIDTYTKEKWTKGTQKLFVSEKSDVRLVGDVEVSPEKVEFRFDEDLMFRIPFRPVVSLTGKVVLKRDEAGFITSYQEFWDQDTISVLKTAKFN